MFVQNATNFSAPEYVDVTGETKITPGCTYEIIVESSPIDGKTKASVNYTVPGRSVLGVVSYAVQSDLPLRRKIFGKTKAKRPEKRKPVSLVAGRYRNQNST
jgi:hypothetical protein